MSSQTHSIELSSELILAYRKMVEDRYQYDRLKRKYVLPKSINEAKVNELKAYFLNYIYPELATRKILDEAFESLDGHIKNPEHLFRLLIDSSMIVLRYGTSLPKILRAGIKALQSYRKATKFEKLLNVKAINSNVVAPIDQSKLERLIAALPYQEIEAFIKDGQDLFQIILDKELVEKILKIMESLISKMKKHTNVYSIQEIRGLELGYKIIFGGRELLDGISQQDQLNLLDLIVTIERDAFEQMRSGEQG